MQGFTINMIKQYKIIIAYDGTDFSGWIQQPDEPSIVQALHDSFEHAFNKIIKLLGASKTDAGVHALGQVAIFKTDLAISADKMKWVWNNALPDSIKIISLEYDADFHPHYRVVRKTYWYHISSEKLLPLFARYAWHYRLQFDEQLLRKALQLFVGMHDFKQLYKGDDREDTMRTIQKITVQFLPEYNAYRIEVVGEKFLRHMVRRIVGAALHVATGKATLNDIENALNSHGPQHLLPTAPAQGLMLKGIEYETK